MTMESILLLALSGFGLLTAGLYLGKLSRPPSCEPHPEDIADDEEICRGRDGPITCEQRKRLLLYQQRVRESIAKQERPWLRTQLREYLKD